MQEFSVQVFLLRHRKEMTMIAEVSAGAIGGAVAIAAGQPMDLMKVRRHLGHGKSQILQIVQSEGVKTLYKGISAPLAMSSFVAAATFGSYGFAARAIEGRMDKGPLAVATAGLIVGTAVAPLYCSSELIKCQMQIQGHASMLGCLKQRVQTLPPSLAVFQGLGLTWLRDMPAFAVYFLTYEWLKQKAGLRCSPLLGESSNESSLPKTMAIGGMAGMASWAVVHPVDVLKSRVQTLPITAPKAERKVLYQLKKGLQAEGPQMLRRGFMASMQRSFIMSCFLFSTYEQVMAFHRNHGLLAA